MTRQVLSGLFLPCVEIYAACERVFGHGAVRSVTASLMNFLLHHCTSLCQLWAENSMIIKMTKPILRSPTYMTQLLTTLTDQHSSHLFLVLCHEYIVAIMVAINAPCLLTTLPHLSCIFTQIVVICNKSDLELPPLPAHPNPYHSHPHCRHRPRTLVIRHKSERILS